MKRDSFFVFIVLNLVCLSTALAQESMPLEYRELIKQALEEYKSGRWDEARSLFIRAHEIFPNARTYRGIGLSSFEGSDYVNTITYLQKSLDDERRPLTKAQREKTEEILSKAKGFVGGIKVSISPKTAQLSVDGIVRRNVQDVLLVNPGKHDLLAEADGYKSRQVTTNVASGATVELEMTLDAIADFSVATQTEPVAQSNEAPGVTDDGEGGTSLVPYIVMGAAGALLIGAGVTSLLSCLAEKELSDNCGPNFECEPKYDATIKNGRNLQIASFILLGASVATAITGLVLWIDEDTEQETSVSTNVSIHCGTDGCLGAIRSSF